MNANLLKALAIDLGRKNLYDYCRLTFPQFYNSDNPHVKILADTLQEFLEGEERFLMINLPPRHGKSLTAKKAVEWYLGHNPLESAIAVSYNEELATDFGETVRNNISTKQGGKMVFADFFPDTKIKRGDSSKKEWSLEGSHFSFLSTSPNGTLTGKGTKLLIIDDLIKNAQEAMTERVLESHWSFYVNTLLSRIESGGKIIIIMTRWSTKDLCGRLLELEPNKWKVINFPAFDGEKMLAPNILSLEEYQDREKKTDPVIFQANYQQKPYDSVDRLYRPFKTFKPKQFSKIDAYFDTADTGSDFFAGAFYGVEGGCAYLLDLIYTQEPMEVTEEMAIERIMLYKPQSVYIESNSGGRGFARAVEKRIRAAGNGSTAIRDFTQTQNKVGRILSNSATVQNCVFMIEGWETRWPKFAKDVLSMGRSDRWAHDDAADMLTGIIEKSLSFELYVG